MRGRMVVRSLVIRVITGVEETKRRKVMRLIIIAMIGLGMGFAAQAVDINKANNTTALNLGGSWTGGVVPGSGDTAVYSALGGLSTALGADLSWQGLVATNNTGNWTITGANTLTLGTGGIQSVGTNPGYLVINARVNQSSAATYDARKIIWINGALSGSGDITKTGGSSLILVADNSGFSGGITHNQGVLAVGNAKALGTGVLTLNGGMLNAYTTDQTIANDIVVTASSKLEAVNTTRDLTLTGAISGSGAITKVNAGTVTLSFDNAYSGGTTVSAGTMVGSVDGAFGVGDVTVANGATLVLGAGTSDQDYIDNLADLVLGTTSVLNLNFTGTDTVGSLSLDGGLTFLAPGTYDAADLTTAGLGTYTGVGSLTTGWITPPPEIGMIALEKLSGTNGLSLTWATGSGYNYTVESRPDLTFGSWATNETGIVGTGGDVTVTITLDQAQSFYRVIGQ